MRPLDEVRVVELGIWVAAPAAAAVLADWGADVVKVEPPAGDPNRHAMAHVGIDQPRSPAFEVDNRGKRGVVLDLKSPDGLEALHGLLADADVFVTNLRPGALERLGLDPATLRGRHPRLVVASITGYGWAGPDRDRPAYDIGAFWARTGLAAGVVPPDQPPPDIPSGLGDRTAATALVAGITAALFARERTGQGEVVEVSLLRSGMFGNGGDLAIQQFFGRRARVRPRAEHASPLLNCYRAGDGRWFWLLGVEGDRHWPALVRAVDRPELLADERFATGRARRAHAADLVALLDEAFAAVPLDELGERLDAAGVWWTAVATLAQVVADPQAEAAGGWADQPGMGGEATLRGPTSPVTFWGAPTRPPRGAPLLGEHSADVLPAASPGPERG